MHTKILSKQQFQLLPMLKIFSDDFSLVGGTAIALHLGHRRSVDFDLFSFNPFDSTEIEKKLINFGHSVERIFVDKDGEFTVVVQGVKITFLHFPYKFTIDEKIEEFIKLPDILILASLKAYALGRRAKWKDYVDIYYILKDHHSLKEIAYQSRNIFGDSFNEKLFRVQLAYDKDIDYSEEIDFMPGFEVNNADIKKELVQYSLEE